LDYLTTCSDLTRCDIGAGPSPRGSWRAGSQSFIYSKSNLS